MPNAPINPKVTAATAAVTGTGSVGVIVLWLLDEYADVDPPSIVKGAIVVLITAAAAFAGGWLKRIAPPA